MVKVKPAVKKGADAEASKRARTVAAEAEPSAGAAIHGSDDDAAGREEEAAAQQEAGEDQGLAGLLGAYGSDSEGSQDAAAVSPPPGAAPAANKKAPTLPSAADLLNS